MHVGSPNLILLFASCVYLFFSFICNYVSMYVFFKRTSFCESSHVLVHVSRDFCICVCMHCLRICIVCRSFKCFLVRFSVCLLIYIVDELIGDMYL